MKEFDESNQVDPLQKAMESYIDRCRRGKRPSIDDYIQQFPDRAEEVRELFSALAMVEEVGAETPPSDKGITFDEGKVLRQLGEYRILREIGRGGMGVVYEAEQESLGRRVALKVLPFHSLMDERRLERFQREARAAARLHHTNIVPVYGIGEEGGIHYYAMQFIQGQSLDVVLEEVNRIRRTPTETNSATHLGSGSTATVAIRLLTGKGHPGSEGKLPPPNVGKETIPGKGRSHSATYSLVYATEQEGPAGLYPHYFRNIAQIGLQIAEALEYAHIEGVLHRDIKPSNLLLDERGAVWITDFGLVKEMEGSDTLTQSGDIVGTLAYMAPERFRGWSDNRSDIYGLGITLYELLTLRPPFQAADRGELIKKITSEEPPRPRRLEGHIPRDLETIVLKAIEKEPSRRYQTAPQFADDLRLFLADKPIQARRTSAIEHAWRWCRRNRTVAALTALAVFLLLIAGNAFLFAFFADRAEREGRYWRHLSQARASRWSGRPGGIFESLHELKSAVDVYAKLSLKKEDRERRLLELRGEAIACETQVDLREDRRWISPEGKFVFDRNFERYALLGRDGDIRICRSEDDRELLRLPGFGRKPVIGKFHPHGQLLVIVYGPDQSNCYRLWDLVSAAPILEGELEPWAMDISLDGRLLAIGRKDGSIALHEATTGNEVKSIRSQMESDDTRIYTVKFHPNGKRMAVSFIQSETRKISILDLENDSILKKLSHPGQIRGIAWHPSGNLLAAACADTNIYLWRPGSGVQSGTLKGHEAEVMDVLFSHQGDLLVSMAWDTTTRLWDPFTGRLLVKASGTSDRLSTHFNLEDNLLAYCKDQKDLILWRVARGQACRTLRGHAEARKGPLWVSISPDGHLLASAGDDGFRLWDLAASQEIAHLPLSTGDKNSVNFHPSGESLITCGDEGLHFWPLVPDQADGSLRVGPPRSLGLSLPGRFFKLSCCSDDGRVLVVTRGDRVQIVDLEAKSSKVFVTHRNLYSVSISPDGQWIATGSWHGKNVKVWDAKSGELLKDLPPESSAGVLFSPDGRWLVISSGWKYSFHEVGSWALHHTIERAYPGDIPGAMAFTGDGELLATTDSSTLIKLFDPRMGRELARMEASEPHGIGWLCFSPGGSRLAASAGGHLIQVWDLHHIRKRLASMELDWDPPLSATEEAPVSKPQRIRVFLGKLGKERSSTELERYNQAIQSTADDFELYHQRAHIYETLGVKEKALEDYKQYIRLEPGQALPYIHSADIYFKLENYEEGVLILEQFLQSDPPPEERVYMAGYLEHILQNISGRLAAFRSQLEGCRKRLLQEKVTYEFIDTVLDTPETLVPEDAEWRFLPGREEPPADWITLNFDDSSWNLGRGGFGFGRGKFGTVLGGMKGSFTSLYIRLVFTVPDPGRFKKLLLSLQADDGFVAFLNGNELGRVNAGRSDEKIFYDGKASARLYQPSDGCVLPLDSRLLLPGKNILAIQGLNVSIEDSDFSLIPILQAESIPDRERERERVKNFITLKDNEGVENSLAYLEGRICQRAGQFEEAIKKFHQVLEKDKTYPEPFLRLAESFRGAGDPELAEVTAREGLQAGFVDSRGLWDFWFSLCVLDLKRGTSETLSFFPVDPGRDREGWGADLRWLLAELHEKKAVRINCGGGEYRDETGAIWGRDRFFTCGHRFEEGTRRLFTENITGTEDDPLYQTERFFAGTLPQSEYRIPLPPGEYRVTLHFAELYWSQPGHRVFGVRLEGRTVLDEYDAAGKGLAMADKKSFDLHVDDGILDIDFIQRIENPKISAIEIQLIQ